ncbi:MAG TPA: type II secretion system F family protein [Gemmataceae bacterium]|nr:type II secretion system F family protein [Gemmataceae bacterium]
MSSSPDPSLPPVDEAAPQASQPAAPARPLGGQLSAEDLIALNEEIAGMARAGLPLDQGLAALAREMGRGRLQQVTRTLADDLKAGFTLPQALERQGGRVPPYYAALLAAGIRSGRIGDVLGTLTIYARSIGDFRSTVISALLYPTIVLILGIGLLVFVGITVLPLFVEIFEQMKVKLPALTKILVFVGQHPLEILVLPVAIVIGGLVSARLLLGTSAAGRVLWARFVYALPLVGVLIRSARLAAFVDLLGLLVDQAIPLPEALRLAAAASSDPLLTEGAADIDHDLRQGVPLGEALLRQRLVPDLVVWMTRFGEKQGTLGTALHHLAQMYRRQAETRATLLRTVLPPLLTIFLAILLGGLFIFGLLSPLFNLLQGLGGGGL